MSYTGQKYLNQMISVALDQEIVTQKEVLSILERHGAIDESIAIDIISTVYQRRRDCVELREMQRIFRHRYDDEGGGH